MKSSLFVILVSVATINLVTCQHHHHHDHQHDHSPHHQHHHHHHHLHQPDGYYQRHHHGWPSHDHHHRHHGGHNWPRNLNFEIREPKGLEVSRIQMGPSETFFGIELYVNQDPRENGTRCDVCHNTTDVTYKKFIIEDEDVIIKKGDLLSYYVLLGNESNVIRHQIHKLWVTDSIINRCNCEGAVETPDIDVRIKHSEKPFHRPSFGNPSGVPYPTSTTEASTHLPRIEVTTEDHFEFEEIEKAHKNDMSSSEETRFECDLDPESNLCRSSKGAAKKTTQTSPDLQQEVQTLNGIINQMKDACTARKSTNKLLLKQAPAQVSGIEQLTDFVRSALAVCPELQDLGKGIHRVMPAGPAIGRGVIFELSDYVDKQKVLYYARLNKLNQVVDYDVASKSY
ncbi:uncharacterized protein LOC131430900 [Malaya genurostris]|uniref:uncharacterized protein LOC131430900 n=1 Tax=Malaya genurostris TaxID=325434 RepID=UPI0026F3DD8D|nr:uncharacterized protein LOC131430900 [Malaya genurostris]